MGIRFAISFAWILRRCSNVDQGHEPVADSPAPRSFDDQTRPATSSDFQLVSGVRNNSWRDFRHVRMALHPDLASFRNANCWQLGPRFRISLVAGSGFSHRERLFSFWQIAHRPTLQRLQWFRRRSLFNTLGGRTGRRTIRHAFAYALELHFSNRRLLVGVNPDAVHRHWCRSGGLSNCSSAFARMVSPVWPVRGCNDRSDLNDLASRVLCAGQGVLRSIGGRATLFVCRDGMGEAWVNASISASCLGNVSVFLGREQLRRSLDSQLRGPTYLRESPVHIRASFGVRCGRGEASAKK